MDDVIKIGSVVAMMLAVGTFVMFMVPIAVRNYRKANLVGRETTGDSMRCGRKSTSFGACRPAWRNWRSGSTSRSGSSATGRRTRNLAMEADRRG